MLTTVDTVRHGKNWAIREKIVAGFLWALAALLLLELAIRCFYVRLILRQFEAQPPFNVALHEADPTAELVTTKTADGLTLRGSLHRGVDHHPRGLVLFCPEVGGSHWSAAWYCEGLLHAGFDALSFDFRGQGESDACPGYTPTHWPTRHELNDVEAALQFVESRPDLKSLPLVLMGISRGSLVALHSAARFPQVRAVCGEGTYTINSLLEHFVVRWAQLYLPRWALRIIPMWHMRLTLRSVLWVSAWRRSVHYAVVEPWLRQLCNRPVLLISGERDNYVPPSIIRGIAKKIASPLCRIWSVPKAKHNQARDVAQADYDQTLEEFFGAVCPLPAANTPQVAAAV